MLKFLDKTLQESQYKSDLSGFKIDSL